MTTRQVPECDGRCCAVFPLSTTRADLERRVLSITDGLLIAAMLVPLDPVDVVFRRVLFDQALGDDGTGREYFTCRHWQEDTRACGIYDDRPAMCRTYPNHGACDHGCNAVTPAAP
jgi:Fe-S-cluster containining protein